MGDAVTQIRGLGAPGISRRSEGNGIVQLPLAGLRIVVTMPPHTWFGGVDFNFAVEMAQELRDLGATVFDLDTGAFVFRNELHIDSAIEALKRSEERRVGKEGR